MNEVTKPYGEEQNYDFEVYRINSDMYGNPRYVVHYSVVPFRPRKDGESFFSYQNEHLNHAKSVLAGTFYRGKAFGGGIAFQTYEDPYKRTQELLGR